MCRCLRLRNLFGEKQGNLLSHLGEAFQIRSVGDGSNVAAVNSLWLWRRDDVLEWLFRGCVSLLEGMSDNSRLHEVSASQAFIATLPTRPSCDYCVLCISRQLRKQRLISDLSPLDPGETGCTSTCLVSWRTSSLNIPDFRQMPILWTPS